LCSSFLPALSRRKSSINSLGELRRGPALVHPIAHIEVEGDMCGQHLGKGLALVLQLLDAVMNHHDHVAIGGEISRIRQTASSWNEPRSALRAVFRDGQVEEVVERVDLAIDGPA